MTYATLACSVRSTVAERRRSGQMKRVLIVDDDPLILDGLRAFFECENIETAGAADRDTAEALIAAEFFPIVLADLRLRSEAEGIHLLESIRRISPRS